MPSLLSGDSRMPDQLIDTYSLYAASATPEGCSSGVWMSLASAAGASAAMLAPAMAGQGA
jgi:hypothetical protein